MYISVHFNDQVCLVAIEVYNKTRRQALCQIKPKGQMYFTLGSNGVPIIGGIKQAHLLKLISPQTLVELPAFIGLLGRNFSNLFSYSAAATPLTRTFA